MGISLAIDEDVVVRTPDDFMAMPEDYCEVALLQMLVNTEGELSGGDDYVQVFFRWRRMLRSDRFARNAQSKSMTIIIQGRTCWPRSGSTRLTWKPRHLRTVPCLPMRPRIEQLGLRVPE